MKEQFRSGFVALVGPVNSGKSTLLNALLERKISIVSPKPHTTRKRVLGIRTNDNEQIVFVDTPGFSWKKRKGALYRQLNSDMEQAAGGADMILLVLDASELINKRHNLSDIRRELDAHNIAKPKIIALNKADLVTKDLLLPVMGDLVNEFGGEAVDFVPISALRRDGLAQLMAVITQRLPTGSMLFPKDAVSDQVEEIIVSETVREKLFLLLHEEVPHSSAVRVDGWQEEIKLLRIEARIFVERESQKAIVIGRKAEMLKQIGSLARADLEKIFGVKIFLKLQVQVEKNWTQSEVGLSRVGLNAF